MSKFWVIILLSCSASMAVAGTTDLKLQWQEDQYRWREEQKIGGEGYAKKWQVGESEVTTTIRKKENELPYSAHEKKPWRSEPFGRAHRSDRMRFVDPTFSEFNSDNGGDFYQNELSIKRK